MKRIVCILLSALVCAALAACAPTAATTLPTTAPAQDAATANDAEPVKLSIQGSTSVTPLMEAFVEAFGGANASITCEVQGTGSSAGIKAAQEGTAQIGMSSRHLKEEEKAELTPVTIAMDGIAVVVNPNNPVKALTKEQITAVFKGEIVNWSELGGADAPIVLISREAGSGTRDAFEEIMALTTKQDDKTISLVDLAAPLIATGNGEIKQNVATKENAIGYLSLGSLDDTLHALDVDGVAATAENVKAGTYAVARPFLVVTKGAPTPESQLLVDFMLSPDGQAIVAQEGYITVD